MKAISELEAMEEIEESMTNFDHTIDEGMEEKLKMGEGKVHSRHSAWEFNGLVWYENGKFKEQIWRYHSPIDEIEADTLEDLMEGANSRHGDE